MRSRPSKSYKRIHSFRETRKSFLIVCEGEKTEPNYFRKFRVSTLTVDIHGIGANTVSLVREAIKLRVKSKYDQVWCVFDKDSFPDGNFNEAIQVANANNVKVAYTNEAFELWYLLHFNYHDSATSRHHYGEMLTARLGSKYKKNDLDMYDKIFNLQATAIKNAKKLLETYTAHAPACDNPSTTVHELVCELLKNSSDPLPICKGI